MPRVFISHSSRDREFVEAEIMAPLKARGVECWYARDDIKTSAEWEREIRRGLDSSDYFLVVLSSNAAQSKWVEREISWATEHRNGRIATVMFDGVDVNEFHIALRMIQHVDFRSDRERARRALGAWADTITMEAAAASAPILAIMGTAGGSGKSSIIAAIAQLVAASGKDVLIIDTDLDSGGATAYLGGWAQSRAGVRSVLEAAYARHSGEAPANPPGAWNVTPPSLRSQSRFGKIYLVPSRSHSDQRYSYPAIADLPDRNATALSIVREAIDLVQTSLPRRPQCILVDCGAENSPLVSAAFVLARYGFVVSRPQPEFVQSIPRLQQMHRVNYPNADIPPMTTVYNRVTPADEQMLGSAMLIPEDPAMPTMGAGGRPIDIFSTFKGVGLNNFYKAVLHMLSATFSAKHQKLLPDEWWTIVWPRLQEVGAMAEALRKRPRYRFAIPLAAVGVLLGLTMAVVAGVMFASGREAAVNVSAMVDLVGAASVGDAAREEADLAAALPGAVGSRIRLEPGKSC